MLQEEQTVTFSPTGMWVEYPLYVKLFSFYLLFVFMLGVARSIHIVWLWWKLRNAVRQTEPSLKSAAQDRLDHLCVKAKSFRNLSHLTILTSIIVLFWSLSDAFSAVATQKVAGISAIAGAAADALILSSGGIVVATGLFCLAMFCERLIRHRKSGWDPQSSISQAPSS